MTDKTTTKTRLCPHCANSIEENATSCPYCKNDVSGDSAPEWLKRDEPFSESRVRSSPAKRFPIPSKVIWPVALVVVALTAFFVGEYVQQGELSLATQAHLKELQTKDQMIQSQQTQLAEVRQQLNEKSNQFTEIKSKLAESQKELAAAQQRLGAARREVNHMNASRSAAAARAPLRRPATSASAAPRRTGEPGVYQTTRPTAVYESPSSTSRIISQIGRGTRINVVSSAGDWLAVRSRHGNPPGYVRSDDARLIAGTN